MIQVSSVYRRWLTRDSELKILTPRSFLVDSVSESGYHRQEDQDTQWVPLVHSNLKGYRWRYPIGGGDGCRETIVPGQKQVANTCRSMVALQSELNE